MDKSLRVLSFELQVPDGCKPILSRTGFDFNLVNYYTAYNSLFTFMRQDGCKPILSRTGFNLDSYKNVSFLFFRLQASGGCKPILSRTGFIDCLLKQVLKESDLC